MANLTIAVSNEPMLQGKRLELIIVRNDELIVVLNKIYLQRKSLSHHQLVKQTLSFVL